MQEKATRNKKKKIKTTVIMYLKDNLEKLTSQQRSDQIRKQKYHHQQNNVDDRFHMIIIK